jgi:hypothetical protein
MHTQYLRIKEDIEFSKVSSAKQMLGKAWRLTHRMIGITATISSGIEPRKGVFYCVLSSLYYNHLDMHTLTPNIQEVMPFPSWLSAKPNLQKLLSPESVPYSPFWTLETNTSLTLNFM